MVITRGFTSFTRTIPREFYTRSFTSSSTSNFTNSLHELRRISEHNAEQRCSEHRSEHKAKHLPSTLPSTANVCRTPPPSTALNTQFQRTPLRSYRRPAPQLRKRNICRLQIFRFLSCGASENGARRTPQVKGECVSFPGFPRRSPRRRFLQILSVYENFTHCVLRTLPGIYGARHYCHMTGRGALNLTVVPAGLWTDG